MSRVFDFEKFELINIIKKERDELLEQVIQLKGQLKIGDFSG